MIRLTAVHQQIYLTTKFRTLSNKKENLINKELRSLGHTHTQSPCPPRPWCNEAEHSNPWSTALATRHHNSCVPSSTSSIHTLTAPVNIPCAVIYDHGRPGTERWPITKSGCVTTAPHQYSWPELSPVSFSVLAPLTRAGRDGKRLH